MLAWVYSDHAITVLMLIFSTELITDASELVAAIALTVLGFNLLGDGIRDALDPRLRT